MEKGFFRIKRVSEKGNHLEGNNIAELADGDDGSMKIHRYKQLFFLIIVCCFFMNTTSCPIHNPLGGLLIVQVYDSQTLEPLEGVLISVPITTRRTDKEYTGSDGSITFMWSLGARDIDVSCTKEGYNSKDFFITAEQFENDLYILEVYMDHSDS